LTKYVTVSVKVPVELREKMRELGIQASRVLRKAIEEEVRRKEVERIKEAVKELKPLLNRLSIEDVVRSIKEDRKSH
jgi:post-segregation antitoxin (ccd killing protein)